jgi:hypothetical protein
MNNEFTGQFKVGPRQKGRKDKGKKRPQAVRQAKKRRSAFVKSLPRSG